MSSGESDSPLVRVEDKNNGRIYEFHDKESFASYLSQPQSPLTSEYSSQAAPYLKEFKTFPCVDQVMILYYDEALKSCDANQRLTGCILVGCLSELLVLHLLKAVGEFLGDPNVLQNYISKKKNPQQQLSFTKQMVEKSKTQIHATKTLTTNEINALGEFNTVAEHVFNSIRLRRNEYAHPTPDLRLDTLPPSDLISTHLQTFNPYAKILLILTNLFKR